jgi:hypothetical protein
MLGCEGYIYIRSGRVLPFLEILRQNLYINKRSRIENAVSLQKLVAWNRPFLYYS